MVLAQSNTLRLVEIEESDIDGITAIFNSNVSFLQAHLKLDSVTQEWVVTAQAQMHQQNFITAKLVEQSSEKMVGYCEYREGETAYLSLLIMDHDIQGRLFGLAAYELLERYLREKGSQAARIDVVYGYEGNAVEFWEKCGFVTMQDMTLDWAGNLLDAHVMVKLLQE